jgi:hypothetical protein
MKKRARFFAIATMAMFLLPLFSNGQSSRNVVFPSGKNSAYQTGTVKGSQYINYRVNVKTGQTINVSINSKNKSVFFNVLPPGSKDVAIYNSSIDGNKFSGVADNSGSFTIRVYLKGDAKSSNVSANFGLTVEVVKPSSSYDAKVAGTKFNATGLLSSSKGSATPGSVNSDFGVIRNGANSADVYVTYPGSTQRILRFKDGEWSCISPNCKVTFTRGSFEWKVSINGTYHFTIPDAVIEGG